MDDETETTKFDYFDVSAVRLFAESRGFHETSVTDDALECLTSDLNYRLREIAHKSTIFMIQKRRRKLTVDDVNLTLKFYNCASILGHKSVEPPKLHYLKELTAFVPNEGVVDLCDFAVSKNFFEITPDPILKCGIVFSDYFVENNVQQDVEDVELVEKCKNTLSELFYLPQTEFRKALQKFKHFAQSQEISCIIMKFLINFLQKTMTNKNCDDKIKAINICRVILNSSVFLRTTNVKLWPLVKNLVEICLDLSLIENYSISFQETAFQFLHFLSLSFNQIQTASLGNIFARLNQILQSEKSDFNQNIKALRGLNVFSAEVQLDDVINSALIHIRRFWRQNENGENFLEYISLWRSILCKLLNEKLKIGRDTKTDEKFWNFCLVLNDFFDDSWIFRIIHFDIPPYKLISIFNEKRRKEDENANLLSKFVCKEKLLEDFIENNVGLRENDDESAKTSTSAVVERPTKSKKRKRKRESSDVFEIPKRFRLCHQRDIVFIFHQTEARTVKTGQKLAADENVATEFSKLFNRKPFSFNKRSINSSSTDKKYFPPTESYDIRCLFL